MWSEIIIIILLAVALYIVLRHWPETTNSRTQQLNVRKPQEEKPTITTKRLTDKSNWWKKIIDLFSDQLDKKNRTVGSGRNESKPSKEKRKEEVSEVEILLAKAEAAQRKGDYATAESLLVKAVTKEPKNPKIYSRLGIIYLEEGENWEEAEESFRQAIKYDSGNGYVHNNLGLVLYNQDKFSAATKEYELAILADSSIASRHVNLGLAYLAQRQFGKAERAFKRALKIDPNNHDYQQLANEAGEKRRQHRQ